MSATGAPVFVDHESPDSEGWRPAVPPIPAGEPRPLWSVMIPTFNCAAHLRTALAGVLAQDPGPDRMHIEVVDDASTRDDPEPVVEELGRGRVAFHRQARNIGVPGNLTACIARSRGRLVHVLHGDDFVLPGFFEAMERGFTSEHVGAAFCRHFVASADGSRRAISSLERQPSGVLENATIRLALEQRIMTPSIVVRRSVYEGLGGFDRRLRCAEDWEMWVRIAARYAIWYESEPLAVYRMHDDSNTGRHVHSADDIRYTREAIDIFAEYLPANVATHIARRARQTYALSALHTANRLRAARDASGAMNQLREALRLSRSPRVLLSAAGTLGRLAFATARAGALPR